MWLSFKNMNYIEIEGYKSIKKARIDLRPLNILIGANGSGKSNFISFFEFLKNLIEGNIQTYIEIKGGQDKFLFQGQKITDKIYFKVDIDESTNFGLALIQSNDGFVYKHENLLGNPFNALNNLKTYQFNDTSPNSPFTKMSHIENDIFYLYQDGGNLAGTLYHIRETNAKAYNLIVKIIQSVAPYFLDFVLLPNEGKYLSLKWKDRFCDTVYGVNDLSDGTLRFIALTVLFMQPNPPEMIIIDEPELGLHPFAVAKLAGMMQSAAARNCQVIAATQSVELINHFEADDVITVDNINGESVFERLSSEKLSVWLDDYSLGDLWKMNIIDAAQPN